MHNPVEKCISMQPVSVLIGTDHPPPVSGSLTIKPFFSMLSTLEQHHADSSFLLRDAQIQVAVSNILYPEILMLIFRKRFEIPEQRFFIEIIHSQLYSWLNTINHNRKRKKKLTKMINRYFHYRSVACIVYFIFRIQRMKKVRHQVMHRTQVTPNAIWKHCELRKDLYFYIFHALPG